MPRTTNRSPKPSGGAAAETIDAPTTTPLDPALTSAGMQVAGLTPPPMYQQPDYTGFEDMEAADIKLPRIFALQAQSPQAMRGNPKYVEGAQAGMLYNSLTGELYDGVRGIEVLPVMRVREELEYIPREKGGGLVQRHDPKDPRIMRLRQAHPLSKAPIGDDGENELVESISLYVRFRHPKTGEDESAMVPFTSTNIDGYKTFYTIASSQKFVVRDKATGEPVIDPTTGVAQKAQYPMFAHRWVLKTQFAQKGTNSWYKVVLVPAEADLPSSRLDTRDPRYIEAHALANLIRAGKVTVDEGTESDLPAHDEVPEL